MRRRPLDQRFSQQSAQKRAIHLHHVWQIEIEHVADRLFHQRMIATDIENAVAAQKIEIRLVIHIVEIRALGTRIDFVEADDALRCYQRAIDMPFVQFVILAQSRGDNLLQVESHEEQNFSDSRSKRKLSPRAVARRHRFSRNCPKILGTAKSCRIQRESRSFAFPNCFRLVFDYHTLDGAMFSRDPCNKHELFDQLAMGL